MFHAVHKCIVQNRKLVIEKSGICRAAGSVRVKDRLLHKDHSPTSSNTESLHKSSNMYNLLGKNHKKWKQKHGDGKKRRNLFVGVVGTVAVFGMGTVLGSTKEDDSTSDLPLRTPTLSPEEAEDGEKADKGKDVVGTEVSDPQHPESAHVTTELAVIKPQLNEPNSLAAAVQKAKHLLKQKMMEAGAPGLVVAVSVDGKMVWSQGFGYADLENNVRCTPDTVMRIASISKSITMTSVAKLWEEGKLDLDAPVQKYVPSFPVKTYDGEEVTITTRQLLCHQSGIRHYKVKDPCKKGKGENSQRKIVADTDNKKKDENDDNESGTPESLETKQEEKVQDDQSRNKEEKANKENQNESEQESSSNSMLRKNVQNNKTQDVAEQKKGEMETMVKTKSKKGNEKKKEHEFHMKEYYIKEEFNTVQEALELFQNDELFFKPGCDYLYSTHAWTLVSAVVEGAAGKPFTKVITELFYDLGLDNTYLDKNAPIIHKRSRNYIRDKLGKLQNAPYVDNSYKWAGGGFLSTINDLCKFGNAMLYSGQQECYPNKEGSSKLPGFLKATTMENLWTPVQGSNSEWVPGKGYGLGWGVAEDKCSFEFCRQTRRSALHTGGAIGASSVLLILPEKGGCSKDATENSGTPPKGTVVAIMTNMQAVGLSKVALQIAELFEKVV